MLNNNHSKDAMMGLLLLSHQLMTSEELKYIQFSLVHI